MTARKGGRQPKLRVCGCCGEAKKTSDYNAGNHGYIAHCMECGMWLYLLRQCFGKSHPSGTKPVYVPTTKYRSPAQALWNAWNGAQI